MNPEKRTGLLRKLGLEKYFPAKISLGDVMSIGKDFEENVVENIPWSILQKLIMLDHGARDHNYTHEPDSEEKGKDNKVKGETDDESDDFSELQSAIAGGKHDINPVDLLHTIFSCCDLHLRQILAQKMFQCRLALPFIFPEMSDNDLCLSLWPLRSIAVECRNEKGEAIENSIPSQTMNVVSFVRLGRPKFSKSKMLNCIISDQRHDTFFNIDCYNGNSQKEVSNGLVEASFFLPSGQETDHFKEMTMFLNLRGDACDCDRQVYVMSKFSNVVVACIDDKDLANAEVRRTMASIHKHAERVLLLVLDKDPASFNMKEFNEMWLDYANHIGKDNLQNTKRIAGFKEGREKNENEMKSDIRNYIEKCLQNACGKLVEVANQLAVEANIRIDETDPACREGKRLADHIKTILAGIPYKDIKKRMLPLQGEHWLEWSKLLKDHNRSQGTLRNTSLQERGRIKTEMTRLRQKQMTIFNNLSYLMKEFISYLIKLSDTQSLMFFLQWLRLHLDQMSRDTLPSIKKAYLEKVTAYQKAKEIKNEDVIQELKAEVDKAAQVLTDSSFGLENMFREMGQIYEAAVESGKTFDKETKTFIEKLPTAVAKLLLGGYSVELMDGNSSCVPLTWVKAVFENIEKIVPNQRVFTLSVLGIQSSGKSTLLNTMFGLEFPVSAGRCTKGVYIQLVKVAKESGLPFDYVVVIDTEGLRAPELGDYKHNHDNELATFVVGLGDATLVNIKGENVAEIEDVLQIVIHAFLRMGIVNKVVQDLRTCLFIHQNVAAVNAKEKMMYGCHKMKDNLDKMTKVAASTEHMTHIDTFNQIIQFDTDHHVWFFSDLWKGDPPMAPANPGYHQKAHAVKSYIFNEFAKDRGFVTRFTDLKALIQDIWNGVLRDDFVFSFRNSLAARAYSRLEETLCSVRWEMQFSVQEWFDKEVEKSFKACSSVDALRKEKQRLNHELDVLINEKMKVGLNDLEKVFQNDDHKEIMIQWKEHKIQSLKISVSELRDNTARDISEKMDSTRCDLQQKEEAGKLKQEIFKRATRLADETKGRKVAEESLEKRFNQMWDECVDAFTFSDDLRGNEIQTMVEKVLRDSFHESWIYISHQLQSFTKLPRGVSIKRSWRAKDITKEDISFANLPKENVVKRLVKGTIRFLTGDTQWEITQQAVVGLICDILEKIEVYLNRLTNTKEKFQSQYATHISKEIKQDISRSRSEEMVKSSGFAILPTLEAKLVVHVFRYAIPLFERMQTEYDKTNCPRAKVQSYKMEIRTMFTNKVRECTEEVIFADMLCGRLEQLIIDDVEQQLPTKVAKEVVLHFTRKYTLIKAVLIDLAEKEKFEEYVSYISHPKTFAEKWVTSFSEKYMFGKSEGRAKTRYADHAENLVTNITETVEPNIRRAENADSVTKWLSVFFEDTGISLSREDKENLVQHFPIRDFHNMSRLLEKRLKDLTKRVIDLFIQQSASSIRWKGKSPYTQVLETLWGCEATCPFCKEPCQFDKAHSGRDHECIQHRPIGASGWHSVKERDMKVENCSYNVQTNGTFICKCSPKCTTGPIMYKRQVCHTNRDYKTYFPDWSIAPSPNMDSSEYWMWFMVTFEDQLIEHYDLQPPEMPDSWKEITKKEAIDSLSVYYG